MSCNEVVLSIKNISKCFEIYSKPIDRLYQTLCAGYKKFYKEFWALRNISFDVHQGECLGIIGRNGAGKSTLLQIITGTLQPTEGSIMSKGRIAALLELGSGFNPDFTGRENVYMYASVLGLSRREIEKKYQAIVDFADIGDFIDQPVKTYSSGMTVRLAFAVIAHVDADILIIDEALSVGDAFFQQKCMRFIHDFRKSKTLLFVSHDMGSIMNLCSSVLFLEKGTVRKYGDTKEVTQMYLQSYFQEQTKIQHCALGTPQEKTERENEISRIRTDVNKCYCVGANIIRDMRADFLNQSNLRNDLQIFDFCRNPNSVLGNHGARFLDMQLMDQNGAKLLYAVGGEPVSLRIKVLAEKDIFSPIVGFHIKDRLGQELLGDNTFLTYIDNPQMVSAGEIINVSFDFIMPVLKKGQYVFDVAIAEGSQETHVQLEWVEDALTFESVSSHVNSIVGLFMQNIKMSHGVPSDERKSL